MRGRASCGGSSSGSSQGGWLAPDIFEPAGDADDAQTGARLQQQQQQQQQQLQQQQQPTSSRKDAAAADGEDDAWQPPDLFDEGGWRSLGLWCAPQLRGSRGSACTRARQAA
jgi:hypothetical protein